MNNTKKEKAITQVLASLSLDNIYVSSSFIDSYRAKNNLPIRQKVSSAPKLSLKRSGNSVRRKLR